MGASFLDLSGFPECFIVCVCGGYVYITILKINKSLLPTNGVVCVENPFQGTFLIKWWRL